MKLKHMRVAILAADGFEQSELVEPKKALEQEGATTKIVSPSGEEVRGWNHIETADKFPVDVPLERANADEFDALLLPGGVASADQLRGLHKAVEFAKKFAASGKPIAAICHGAWTLIEAGAVRGRKLTSWPTLKTDLKNAGANWVDEEVVVDQALVTSRKPADIPAFNEKMIEVFAARRVASAGGQSRGRR